LHICPADKSICNNQRRGPRQSTTERECHCIWSCQAGIADSIRDTFRRSLVRQITRKNQTFVLFAFSLASRPLLFSQQIPSSQQIIPQRLQLSFVHAAHHHPHCHCLEHTLQSIISIYPHKVSVPNHMLAILPLSLSLLLLTSVTSAAPKPPHQSLTARAVLPQGWSYTSCLSDSSARTLAATTEANSGMTIPMCLTSCAKGGYVSRVSKASTPVCLAT
jgi:hypothetical protein